jgi:hypothetical protein
MNQVVTGDAKRELGNLFVGQLGLLQQENVRGSPFQPLLDSWDPGRQ